MNAQQHIPLDDLAAYAAGDLDATAAVAVEAHLVLCAECRSDIEAVAAATTALTGLVRPPAMPAGVAARIDAALAAERSAAPAGDVVPLAPRRRRPSFAGLAAVAAGIALFAAISVPFLHHSPSKSSTTAASGATRTTRRLTSGLDYTHTNLAATLTGALEGRAAEDSGQLAGGVSGPGSSGAGPEAPEPSPAFDSKSAVTDRALQVDTGRLAACISSLGTGLPPAAQVPLVVDFARYDGKPAVVVAFPTVSEGTIRTDKIDVFVVGEKCGVTAGDDDVLDFARIPRPRL